MCQDWLSDQNLHSDETELMCGDFDEAVATVPFSSDVDSLCAECISTNIMSESAKSEERDLAALRRCVSTELQLRNDVLTAYSHLPQESREQRIQNLAKSLRSLGYGVYIRNGSSFSCTTRTFLIVFVLPRSADCGQKKSRTAYALVDLDVRDVFEIPRASLSYNRLLSVLPHVFIAPCKLSANVCTAALRCASIERISLILCNAAEKSLTDNGLDIAPWRKFEHMLENWFQPSVGEQSEGDSDFWEPMDSLSPVTPLNCR